MNKLSKIILLLGLLFIVPLAHATTVYPHYDHAYGQRGNYIVPIQNALVTVCEVATVPCPTISKTTLYSDDSLTPLANPLTANSQTGDYHFYWTGETVWITTHAPSGFQDTTIVIPALAGSASTPCGSDGDVQYNSSGAFGCDPNFTYANGVIILKGEEAGYAVEYTSDGSDGCTAGDVNGTLYEPKIIQGPGCESTGGVPHANLGFDLSGNFYVNPDVVNPSTDNVYALFGIAGVASSALANLRTGTWYFGTKTGLTEPICVATPSLCGAVGKIALTDGGATHEVYLQVPASSIAADFNFNLPSSAGSSGQPLLSGGGGSAPHTYGSVSGTGAFCLVTSCTMVTPALGTPSAINLTNATALPASALPAIAQDCGTTTTCAATAITATLKIVKGSVPLSSGAPSTATVTGFSPAFTSSSSFVCTVTEASSATGNLLKVVNASASSITITGPATVTDVINYICIGN